MTFMANAVIFDWGGVLIDAPARGLEGYCAEHLGVDEERLVEVFGGSLPEFQMGEVSEETFWEGICKELNIEVPSVPLWSQAFRAVYSPKQEMFSLVSSLRREGYKTGLLSNKEMPAVEYFHEQRYDTFDTAVFSCIEGSIKPENEIYNVTLERLGVRPDAAVFVDDNGDNVRGAEAIGMRGILFESASQVKRELYSQGVTW